jgi:hypothetical protein
MHRVAVYRGCRHSFESLPPFGERTGSPAQEQDGQEGGGRTQ